MTPERYVFAPELWAAYGHEFGDVVRRVDTGLAGTPSAFIGSVVGRDSGRIGAGWRVSSPERLNLALRYDANLNADFANHSISVQIWHEW